jgi:hypothetical protein
VHEKHLDATFGVPAIEHEPRAARRQRGQPFP